MTQDHDSDPESARPKADADAPAKRKRVAGLAKSAKVSVASDMQGERIAKAMARAGLCSRREAEAWIADGRVSVNGKVLETPAVTVSGRDRVEVDGQPLPLKERTRLFLYHKPRGLVTTTHDPEGRPTVFEKLPEDMPRVVTVGRLDINTEGLLLLTNDGGLARVLELPATGWLRRYRVRAFGEVTKEQLDTLKEGVTIEGISYGPVEAEIDTVTGSNVWLMVGLREGKNREVKRILQHLGLTVNRLIRVSFGPFQLADLDEGEVREIRGKVLRDQLGKRLVDESGADFDAPIIHHIQGGETEDGKVRRPIKQGADKPVRGEPARKRTGRTHMEFLGTGEDGSRQARLDRDGKPPVAVKYKARREDDSSARGRSARAEGKPARGFAPRTDSLRDRKPVEGPERAERPARTARPERTNRPAEEKRGDRPLRSEGFRDRPSGARGERQPSATRGDRPYRSEGTKDRPTGGMATRKRTPEGAERPYRDDKARPSRDGSASPKRGSERPDRPTGRGGKPSAGDAERGPRGPRGGGFAGTKAPRGKGAPKADGPNRGGSNRGGPNKGGAGADRRR